MAKEKEMKKQAENSKDKKKDKELSPQEEKIAQLENQVEEYKNDYLRSRADFENYRKRKEQEIADARDRAVIDFIEELLPSIDNFEMSLKMTDNKEMFIKGVEMIHKNLIDTLKEHHVEEFEPELGHEFDPYLHEPVMIENKEVKPGTIVGVIKKGYRKKEKVVRPARVQVAKEEQSEEKKE